MSVIDCDTCPVRGARCSDCIVPVVARTWLDAPRPRERGASRQIRNAAVDASEHRAEEVELSDAEWDAVDVFVGAGLVNPLDALAVTATTSAHGWSYVG